MVLGDIHLIGDSNNPVCPNRRKQGKGGKKAGEVVSTWQKKGELLLWKGNEKYPTFRDEKGGEKKTRAEHRSLEIR